MSVRALPPFHLAIAVDDLAAARDAGAIASETLTVTVQDLDTSLQLAVIINGQIAGGGTVDGEKIVFTDPPIERGVNHIAISLAGADGASVRVEGTDYRIGYR